MRTYLLVSLFVSSTCWVLQDDPATYHRRRTRLWQTSVNDDMQQRGDRLIRHAAIRAGCQDNQIDIEWKGGRVVITISGSTYMQDEDPAGDKELGDDALQGTAIAQEGVNLVEVSRAIHAALDTNDEESVGWHIAANHEVEVTTPGASNVLTSDLMFKSYRGFEIMVDFTDPKTKKSKKINGRLVERNGEFTVINIKGRMKKIRNDMIKAVTLPKAKKEKGVR